MTSPKPLHGIELINCAQANAKSGLSVATKQCGYGSNTSVFQNELLKAADEIGIHISNLNELIIETHNIERERVFSPNNSGRI